MENNKKRNYSQEGYNPKENQLQIFESRLNKDADETPNNKFSPLNIGSIDYNGYNGDLDPNDDEEGIFDEDYDFEDDDEDSSFRTHAL